jgi:hypothetical protein
MRACNDRRKQAAPGLQLRLRRRNSGTRADYRQSRAALADRGVAHLAISKDVQMMKARRRQALDA